MMGYLVFLIRRIDFIGTNHFQKLRDLSRGDFRSMAKFEDPTCRVIRQLNNSIVSGLSPSGRGTDLSVHTPIVATVMKIGRCAQVSAINC